MGDYVSFGSGVVLLLFGTLGMMAYRPKGWRIDWGHAPSVLGFAVFLGFVALTANTLYWQVFGQVAVEALGVVSVTTLRAAGGWMDLLFKGGGAVAGYLHLRALWLQLSDDERTKWGVLEMAVHPNRWRCLSLLSGTLRITAWRRK